MLNQLTISALVAKLARREVSARAATQACLDRIERVDPQIRAFISYDAADALAQADAADLALAQGQTHAQKPLLGVPVGIKDVIAVKGQPLNCGSKILGKYISPYDATAVEKLKAAGVDAVNLVAAAVAKSGSSDAEAIIGAWNKLTKWPGLFGDITFTPEQHNGYPTDEVVKV